jgi:acyl carrier protein
MTANAEQICSEICRLLQPYNKANVTLTGGTDLTADLEMDSVAAMNLVMEIEDSYEIDIPINLLSDVTCPDDLTKLVMQQLGNG